MNNNFRDHRPIRVAIVGSGPSGMFTAEALLKSALCLSIDVFEQLPTPYGLVRSGVAPDHPNIKKVSDKFDRIWAFNNVSYYGNVTIGQDIGFDELRCYYDVIVFSCGAPEPKPLNIPGVQLPGCHAAIEFISWLNGHPHYQHAHFDLSHKNAVIIGQGNVALDVARLLVKTVDELRNTDITQHALNILAASKVRNVLIIGRRGPAQTAFSYKELKEISELSDCYPYINPTEVTLNEVSEKEIQDPANGQQRQIYSLLNDIAHRPPTKKSKRLEFKFLSSPVSLVGDGRVEKLMCEKNQLEGLPGHQKPYGTGEEEELKCGLVFCSIGHRGTPMNGIPYDKEQGIFTNCEGRILHNGLPVPGVYAVGWIQRGSNGLIGNNKQDAAMIAKNIARDICDLKPCPKPDRGLVLELLNQRQARVVTIEDWQKIDAIEKERGKARGKPREKFKSVAEMVSLL